MRDVGDHSFSEGKGGLVAVDGYNKAGEGLAEGRFGAGGVWCTVLK